MSSKKGQKSSNSKLAIRKRRIFSDAFKRQKVSDMDSGLVKLSEICELYNVSRTSVYRWIYKYSPHHKQGTNQIVEMKSEAAKTKKLKEQVTELEAALGRKQLEVDYLSKLIELANCHYETDLKKNYDSKC